MAITKPALTVLRRKQVELRTGLSRSTIYSKLRFNPHRPKEFDPSFPKPISLGEKAVGWLSHEIDDWLALRPRAGAAPDETDIDDIDFSIDDI
jgi:prophage regulatory protein